MSTLSHLGARMARTSGLRSIMEDVAATRAAGPGERWLNLGVGNPALIPEAVAMWRALAEEALAEDFVSAGCLYGPSRGTTALVDAVVEHFDSTYGWDIGPENVVVGPGSQMLCFIAAALFSGPGERGRTRVVLPALPDYAGYLGMSLEQDGLGGVGSRIVLEGERRFVYELDHEELARREDLGLLLLSSPCNPTGRSADERDLRALAGIASARGAVMLVDNAYGAPFPQVVEAAAEPLWHPDVINCFSASKAGLPGERVGFAVGPRRHIDAMVSFIANSTLHAPQLIQLVLARALSGGRLAELAASVIRPYYLSRRQAAEKLLAELLPADVDWRLHTAQGGMFCWLWINEPWFDDLELYHALKERRVVVVPGRHFFPAAAACDEHATRCVRISVTGEEAVIRDGIAELAEALLRLRRRRGADRS